MRLVARFQGEKTVRATTFQDRVVITGHLNGLCYRMADGSQTALYQNNAPVYVVHAIDDDSFLLGDKAGCIKLITHGCQVFQYKASDTTVSSLELKGNYLLFGDWDGRLGCIVLKNHIKQGLDDVASRWTLSDDTLLKYGVCFCFDPSSNACFAASQIATLLRVDLASGNVLASVPSAHADIIRHVKYVVGQQNQSYLLTCSNDGFFGLWDPETLICHGKFTSSSTGQSFCFDADCYWMDDLLIVITAQEDGSLYRHVLSLADMQLLSSECIWQHCSSIWTVDSIKETGDIVTGTDDGSVMVFHRDDAAGTNCIVPPQSQMGEAAVTDLRNSIQKQIEETQRNNPHAHDLSKLPKAKDRAAHPGRKAGQTSLFLSDDGGTALVYQWSGREWIKVGEMVGNSSGDTLVTDQKLFAGDEYFPAGQYDYIFDVEIDSRAGARPLLPFNIGQNFMDVAERFCARENIPKANMNDIVKFLQTNTQGGQSKQPVQAVPEQKDNFCAMPPFTPVKYDKLPRLDLVFAKLEAFDEQNPEHPLEDMDKALLLSVKQSLSDPHFYRMNTKSTEVRWLILEHAERPWSHWPNYFPVLDLWRTYLCHHDTMAKLRKCNRGSNQIKTLTEILKGSPESTMRTMAARCLANMAVQAPTRDYMVDNIDAMLAMLPPLATTDAAAISPILLNLLISAYIMHGSTSHDKVRQIGSKIKGYVGPGGSHWPWYQWLQQQHF